ncbi:MAG TPA: MFS transporter [Nevskiaceae bacterium]|nr:MFS transporter [Nevskiaceae bacterium]
MTTAPPPTETALRRSVLTAFTLPTLVLGIMHGPEGQVQSVYAKHAGVALTALAAAMLFSKMFDAITYPLIGLLSDRSYARSGTRKGWVIGGAAVSLLGIWKLMRPPQEIDAFYFGLWMSVTYLGWKLMEIPLQAWSYVLSEDYAQRSRVQAWRGLAALIGTMLFFGVPYLAVKLGYSDSTEIDFRSLGFSAVVCLIVLPLATLLAVVHVPDGTAAAPPAARRFRLSEVIHAVWNNRPLLHLIAAFLPVSLLGGLMNGVAYLYLDAYLHLSTQFAAIMGLAMLASVVSIPFWSAMAARFERHRVWAVALIVDGLACGAMSLLEPGAAALPLALVIYPVITFTTASTVVVYTMSADIVDHGRLLTGEDHAGLYGAIFVFLQKSVLGVSSALGLAIAGYFGFDATASTQTASGILGIKLPAGILPGLGLIAAAIIIWSYPLTRARVAEIQRQLHKADR